MPSYLLLKTLHILGALLFFGVGLGSAWYKFKADRSGDLRVIAWCQNQIVTADWVFTLTSAFLLPITGLEMVRRLNIPWTTPWVVVGIAGYVLAGLLWLPAVWLQIRMRDLAREALQRNTPLPHEFHRANRIWFYLGVPAFAITVGVIWVMVAKWQM